MTPYDLIIAILDSEGGNEQSTIELVNELVSYLLDENSECTWGKNLATEIEDFANTRNRCPNCGSRLIYKKVGGTESEYMGLPVTEDCAIEICEECNFVEGE